MTATEKTLILGLLVGGGFLWYGSRNANPLDTTSNIAITAGAALKKLQGDNMATSQAGRDAIVQREDNVSTVYADVVGYLTAGVGHKIRPSDGAYSVGDYVDSQTIGNWFDADISHAENTVLAYVSAPLNQNQFDALVSAVFNLGSALFRNGDGSDTHILTALNAGDYSAAAQLLKQFNHAGGRVVAGLTARRDAESAQFLT